MNAIRSPGSAQIVKMTTALACLLTPLCAFSQGAELGTKSANEVGMTFSSYQYNEPGVATIKAAKVGFEYSGTYAFGSQWPQRKNGWFVRGDLRYATGKADYSSPGTGTLNNRTHWYYEVKGVVGKDFSFDGYSLSPYGGFGYRYLFNDLRGVSSTGALGYRRESNYYTLPVGFTHRTILANQSTLATTIEYDYFLRGQQDSKLSDTNPATANANNRQNGGYGLKLATMVQFSTWSVGPFVQVWRINQSNTVNTPAVTEPKNRTTEFGVKAAFAF